MFLAGLMSCLNGDLEQRLRDNCRVSGILKENIAEEIHDQFQSIQLLSSSITYFLEVSRATEIGDGHLVQLQGYPHRIEWSACV